MAHASTDHRVVDPAIEVLDGTTVEPLWERFEVFEALHHTMQICNPMTTAELDETIEALELTDGQGLLDIACGYGETLFCAASRAEISGVGIDLSPWMITAAHRAAAQQLPDSDLHWVLGEARNYRMPVAPDVVICIGAEWVWHGLNGTVREIANRVIDGGLVVIGGARQHRDASAEDLEARGYIETINDVERMAVNHGLTIKHRIDPDDDGWDRYLDRTASAVQQWAQDHPGARSQRWIEEQADWQAARDRDRNVMGWSLWIAQKDATPSRPFSKIASANR